MEENQPQAPDFSNEEMKMPETAMVQNQSQDSSSIINGPLLLILAVLLIIILGGMYYWFSTMNLSDAPQPAPTTRPSIEENNEPESTTAEAQVETMQAVSTSDELTAIEADLEATNLESLDAELEAIDAELEAAANAQ